MSPEALTVEEFLERLSSSAPTPGGGSAAAVMGAMGAALVAMVCNVSVGKKGCENSEAELNALRDEAQMLRMRLTQCVNDDIAAFDGLMTAYKRPKGSDEEKATRSSAIQASLVMATEVPLACARDCAGVIALAQRAAALGYQGVISDAGVAVLAAFAALRSAALNVYMNAPALKDKGAAARFLTEINGLMDAGMHDHETVYAAVRARI